MIYLSATEAKQNFTEFLDKAQKEPITIQRQEQDLVVVLSVLEYQRLTKLLKNEFQGFCDQVGNKFLSLAVTGNANIIITGDEDLLVLKCYQNIPILSPRDFLAQVDKS